MKRWFRGFRCRKFGHRWEPFLTSRYCDRCREIEFGALR